MLIIREKPKPKKGLLVAKRGLGLIKKLFIAKKSIVLIKRLLVAIKREIIGFGAKILSILIFRKTYNLIKSLIVARLVKKDLPRF